VTADSGLAGWEARLEWQVTSKYGVAEQTKLREKLYASHGAVMRSVGKASVIASIRGLFPTILCTTAVG